MPQFVARRDDGTTDFAVVDPGGVWTIRHSSDGSLRTVDTGLGGRPVPGYWDLDGRADPAMYVEGGKWYIHRSCGTGQGLAEQDFGAVGDEAVPGDYVGDSARDETVFHPSSERWEIRGTDAQQAFGFATDVRVPADYDGRGKADLAVFRRGTATWWIRSSEGGNHWAASFGLPTDRLVPADYDGDSKADLAVLRRNQDGGADWIISLTGTGGYRYVTFGIYSDVALPETYLP